MWPSLSMLWPLSALPLSLGRRGVFWFMMWPPTLSLFALLRSLLALLRSQRNLLASRCCAILRSVLLRNPAECAQSGRCAVAQGHALKMVGPLLKMVPTALLLEMVPTRPTLRPRSRTWALSWRDG